MVLTCFEGGIWRNMIEHEKYGGITNMYHGKNMGAINLLQMRSRVKSCPGSSYMIHIKMLTEHHQFVVEISTGKKM